MPRPTTLLAPFVAGVLLAASLAAQTRADVDVVLAPAPVAQPGDEDMAGTTAVESVVAIPVVDNANRYQVGRLFQQHFRAQGQVPSGWNGNVAACNAGTTTQAYRQAAIDRVNLYRVLAGLPGNVALKGGAQATGTQAAALIFSANHALSHEPPSSWLCWTQAGYDGASGSNIAMGYGSNSANGTAAMELYMDDAGVGNHIVGHRRWMLYPPQVAMDSGSVPWNSGTGQYAANALYVLGAMGTRPATPQGVAWPARGYMPHRLLPRNSKRWSLSIRNANFDAATVQMRKNGVPLPDPDLEPVGYNGQPSGSFIGDNTLVWLATGVDYSEAAKPDVTYHVKVSGISGSGVPGSVEYDVIVFDADDPVFAGSFE